MGDYSAPNKIWEISLFGRPSQDRRGTHWFKVIVHLREGILASGDINLADELVSNWEAEARKEIKSERSKIKQEKESHTDDGDDEWGPAPPRATDIASSSNAAPASTRGVHTADGEDDETSGDGDAQPHNNIRKIRMQDIPQNIILRRVDTNTVDVLPASQFRLLIAQLLSIRREAIEKNLDTSNDRAENVYVTHEYQRPIRRALEDFWEHQLASERTTGWQYYLTAGSPGDCVHTARSYRKDWQTEIFGNEKIYDLFVAFGWVNRRMVDALNDAALERIDAKSQENEILQLMEADENLRKYFRTSVLSDERTSSAEESIVDGAVRKYLANSSWHREHVVGWKRKGRKRRGCKSGHTAEKRRR